MSQTISEPVPTSVTSPPGRPSGRVRLWATLGGVLVVLAVVTWTRGLLTPQATPVDPGPDPYPYAWVIRVTEVLSLSVFLGLLWWTLARPAYRECRLTLDSFPALPSYQQGGLWCGQPGKPLCPGQYLDQHQRDHGPAGGVG